MSAPTRHALRANEAEKLIHELETIYQTKDWRKKRAKVERVEAISRRLNALLTDKN